jgi:hypothetical protein
MNLFLREFHLADFDTENFATIVRMIENYLYNYKKYFGLWNKWSCMITWNLMLHGLSDIGKMQRKETKQKMQERFSRAAYK